MGRMREPGDIRTAEPQVRVRGPRRGMLSPRNTLQCPPMNGDPTPAGQRSGMVGAVVAGRVVQCFSPGHSRTATPRLRPAWSAEVHCRRRKTSHDTVFGLPEVRSSIRQLFEFALAVKAKRRK